MTPAKPDRYDVMAAIGTCLLVLGVGLISVPAGLIAAGLGFIGFAVIGALASNRSANRSSTRANGQHGQQGGAKP